MTKEGNGMVGMVNIVLALMMVVIVGAIGIFIADTTLDATDVQETAVAATGTLTFSGNASCGELVNITTAAGTLVTFELNITTPDAGICAVKHPWTAAVTMAVGHNTSTEAAANLTTAINTNATINASMTATNPSAGVVLLTHDTAGTTGNDVLTAETAAAGAWAAATLTGGLEASLVGAMQTNFISASSTGSSFVIILIIAAIGGLAISYLFGMLGRRRV